MRPAACGALARALASRGWPRACARRVVGAASAVDRPRAPRRSRAFAAPAASAPRRFAASASSPPPPPPPPPSPLAPPPSSAAAASFWDPPELEPVTSAYVHLPFCRRRCYYCDFAISVVGDDVESDRVRRGMEQYVDVLCREIAATPLAPSSRSRRAAKPPTGATEESERRRRRSGGADSAADSDSDPAASPRLASPHPLRTVFFGGGTPSLVPPDLLRRVLSALDARFGIHPDAEISAEMDPGTFDRAKLDAFVAAGVTRVSLGAQSFDPEVLKLAGRAHTVAETRRAIEWLGDVRSRVRTDAAGERKQPGDGTNATSSENGALGTRPADDRFRWSLDLISGLPGLTRDAWLASLREAIRHEPDHVSVYDLQVEEGTPFARWYSPGAHPLPSDSDAARMFRDASEVLRTEGGYEHYEVSSYAKRGARCLHNETYWDAGRRGWYAFGMAATSATGEKRGRVARPRKMSEYYAWVDAMEGPRGVPREQGDEARAEDAAFAEDATFFVSGGEGDDDDLDDDDASPPSREERRAEALLERIMLGLRTRDGVDLVRLRAEFGEDAPREVLEALSAQPDGLAALTREREGLGGEEEEETPLEAADLDDATFARVRLTDPEGLAVSTEIIANIVASAPSMKAL